MIATNSCTNCANIISDIDKYCNNCGQKTKLHRLSTHDIWHDAMHAFLHADKGIVNLTKDLAKNPGKVAKEYVAGKRKKYFNPFSYLVITIAISAFITSYFHLMEGGNSKNPVADFIEKHVNLIFFAAVPVSAFFSFLLFKKKQYNYAENLVINAFLSGFRVVFYILIFTPLVIIFRHNYYLVLGIYMAAWIVYISWAHYQFYEEKLWIVIIKTIVQSLLTQVVLTVLISAGIYIYYKFFYHH